MTITNADLQRLLDEREIEKAVIETARAMDARDWPRLTSLIAEDAYGELGSGPLHGRAAIVDLIRSYLDHCGPTQHLIGNVLVDVDGDRAISRAYVRDLHLSAHEPDLTFHTLGDYTDRWERRSGQWRLVERRKDNRATVGSLDVFTG